MLPTQNPASRPQQFDSQAVASRSQYDSIISRNIFSADGSIPDALAPAGQQNRPEDLSAPVLSSLPLSLKGTIVHSNPAKSIANIEVRSKNQVLAFAVGRDIEGLATLQKVERTRAVFKNLNNNRLEYIEMKLEGGKINFTGAKASMASDKSDVAQVAPNKFEIKKSDLSKYTSDLSSLLQQASTVPVRGANGEIEGFRFVAIQPGSVFTQLGLQPGDVLKGVNGEKIDSPAKAMELYNTLKNAASINLQLERDGRAQDLNYTVK